MAGQLVERGGVVGVVLDPQEEDELVEQLEGLDEEERQGRLRSLKEYLAESRARRAALPRTG
jgi:hypothetical protein